MVRKINGREVSIDEILRLSKENLNSFYLHDELRQIYPDIGLITTLIQEYPQRVFKQNENGSIALHIACSNIDCITISIIDILYQYNPNGIQHLNKYKMLPLHIAASSFQTLHGYKNIVKLLELFQCGLSYRTNQDQLPLHLAMNNPQRLCSDLIVSLFITHYPEAVQSIDKFGRCPIHLAVSKTKTPISVIQKLLEEGPMTTCIKDCNGYLPLHQACSKDHASLEVIEMLIDAYPEGLLDFDYDDKLPLDRLVLRNDLEKDVINLVINSMEFTRRQIIATTTTDKQEQEAKQSSHIPSPLLR